MGIPIYQNMQRNACMYMFMFDVWMFEIWEFKLFVASQTSPLTHSPDENTAHKQGDQHPSRTEGHRADGPARFGPKKHFGYVLAEFFVCIRHGALGAHNALRFVARMSNLRGCRQSRPYDSIKWVTHKEQTMGNVLEMWCDVAHLILRTIEAMPATALAFNVFFRLTPFTWQTADRLRWFGMMECKLHFCPVASRRSMPRLPVVIRRIECIDMEAEVLGENEKNASVAREWDIKRWHVIMA